MFITKKTAVHSSSRAQFLRGDFAGKKTALRPPWSLQESSFIEACSRCNQCIDACPEKIIKQGRGGFPEIDFSLGECTFCAGCVIQCKDGALKRLPDDDVSPWHIKAQISDRCLLYSGVVCLTCGEQCEMRAIEFTPRPGGTRLPEIDGEACTGCGACFKPCPVQAIDMIVAT